MQDRVENVASETPKTTPRKRREITVGITLRIPKWWVKKLDRIAREFSLRYQDTINHNDLIRDAIESVYIIKIKRTLTYRKYNEEQEWEVAKTMSAMAKAAMAKSL